MGRHRAPKRRSVQSRAVRTALATVTAAGAVGAAGLSAALAQAAPSSPAPAPAVAFANPAAGFRFVGITASDGVDLKANVIEPGGPGPHPAVVFVNSWGLNTGLLDVAAELTGHPSDELTQMIDDMYTNQNIDQVQAWAKVRSADTYIDQLNAHGTAVYIANAFGDSLFAPDQLVDFYDRLTVPDKRLDLAPGDHATVEGLGLAALPNAVWANVGDWLDEHVAGTRTGVRDGVTLTPYDGGPEAFPNWPATATHTVGYDFGAAYHTTIASGRDTTADAGVPLITNGLAGLTGIPPTTWLPAVDRGAAAVWQSGWLPSTAHVRGIANLHIDLTPSAPTGTAVAYLYDVDIFGTAKLMSHVPCTYLGARPGQPIPVDFRFSAAAFDVPAGHRLAVVVDTKDPLYGDADVPGSTVTVGSAGADHAVLTVPEE